LARFGAPDQPTPMTPLGTETRRPSNPSTVRAVTALALGAGGAAAMIDRMRALPVPVPRWLRQWLRLALIGLPTAAVWTAIAALLHTRPSPGLVAEAAVCGPVALAAAAYAGRYRHTPTAALAGPVTQATLLIATVFPQGRHSPWTVPADPAGARCTAGGRAPPRPSR
jgi:hypothetical protein